MPFHFLNRDQLNEDLKNDIHLLKGYTHRFYHSCKQFCLKFWQQSQSKIDRLVQSSIAISTATSTLELSIRIIPIALSVLTIVAAAPILSHFFPAFLLDKSILFMGLFLLSVVVGYSKYKELITRAELDDQINKNKGEIQHLNKELKELKNQFEVLPAPQLFILHQPPLNLSLTPYKKVPQQKSNVSPLDSAQPLIAKKIRIF